MLSVLCPPYLADVNKLPVENPGSVFVASHVIPLRKSGVEWYISQYIHVMQVSEADKLV